MRSAIFPAAILLALLPVPASAKGLTVRITIEGGSLKAPIEITDAQTLAAFNIWSGPGTFGSDSATLPIDPAADVKVHAPSFVVDWSQGIIAAPSPALPRYKVSFWASDNPRKLAYLVSYVFDPSTKRGYIYLPGKNDAGHYIDAGSVYRGIEGNWFRAWSAWDRVASPLIAAHL